jgi:TetR/AcrR family transcriptional repressor of lmrAB and yxaGH operons
MIEVAATLLRRQGYHATTLVQVVDEGCLPRGSIYHHFPGGKPELVAEVISTMSWRLAQQTGESIARAGTVDEVIAIVLTRLADELSRSGFVDGCWFASTALEVSPEDEHLADLFAREFAGWEVGLASVMSSFGTDDADALALARLLIAAAEGGLLRARAARSTAPLIELIPPLQAAARGLSA